MKVSWIGFSNLSYRIDASVKNGIAQFAKHLQLNPSQLFEIVGYGAANYEAMQLSWSRVDEIRQLLVDSFQIDAERIILKYGQSECASYLVKLVTVELDTEKRAGRLLPPLVPHLIDKKNKRIKKMSR